MGDDILKTGSSLSEIINKQHKANISCEESQTLFDYYVSTLQANYKAPLAVTSVHTVSDISPSDPPSQEDLFPNVDEVDKSKLPYTNFGPGEDIYTSLTLPLVDVLRKRHRYQSPLETIEECELHVQKHQNVNVRREPERKCETETSNSHTASNSTVTRKNCKNKFKSPIERRSFRSGVQMLYQTEAWTQEDEDDRFCVENKLLLNDENALSKVSYKKYGVLEPKGVTNSFRDAHRSFGKSQEVTSKISSIEGKSTESCTAHQSVGSLLYTAAADDRDILVMPKLSVVDIQSYHVRSISQRVKVNSAVCPDVSALQEHKSLKADFPCQDIEYSDSIFHEVEKDIGMSSERKTSTLQHHTRRKDADKHIEMVKEKQQRAKELFLKLKSIDDKKVQTIAYNSSMVLEASIKKCALLRISTSLEPEEVISATTIMLDDLTNLISTTSSQIRQVAKGNNIEGENLSLEPFLSGPRSISSLFSSTETLMSPVRLSSSSFEMDSGGNLFTKQVRSEDVYPASITTYNNETADSDDRHNSPNPKSIKKDRISSDYEYEIVKSVDLISFVDDQDVIGHSYQQLNEAQPISNNIMDAELEELPGWQKNNNLIGAGELVKQWERDQSRSSENASSMKESSINNATVEDFKKMTDNGVDRIQMHSTSCTNNATPVNRRPKSRNRSVMRPERDVHSKVRVAPCSLSQNITQLNKIHSSGQTKNIQQEKNCIKKRSLLLATGIHAKELRKTSLRRETHFSDSRTVDKNQRHSPSVVHEQRIKNKELCSESVLRSSNKQVTQQGQLTRPPTAQAKHEQKRKSNTLTLKSKETKNVVKTIPVKDTKANKLSKQVQITNKTLERNLSSICDKISVLKSCVADTNTCLDTNVTVARCVVEANVDDKLPFVSTLSTENSFNNRGNRNRKENNITEKSTKIETGSTANSYVPEIQQEKSSNDNTKSVFSNTQTMSYPSRLKSPESHPSVQKDTSKQTNVLSSNYLGYSIRSQYGSTYTAHRDSDRNKKRTINNRNQTQITTKGGRNVYVDKDKHTCSQTKRESRSGKVLPEVHRHAERPKRLLTHQEIQEWVNFNHQHHRNHGQRGCKHSSKRRKQSPSPNRKKSCPFSGGTKSAREIPHRVQSVSPSTRSRIHSSCSKRTKCSVKRDQTSNTSLTDLVSVHSSPCLERTASQLIMDSLTDTVECGLNLSLSSKRDTNIETKFRHLCENTAKEIINKIGSCDDDASTNSSSLHATINHLVKSLDKTIHARSDKRVCWDSSTDTPPRSKSAPEETQLDIVETGSRVLETITNKLIRKISVKANRAGCRDDPETEVSYNAKISGDSFSSPSSFYESDVDSTTPRNRRAPQNIPASESRMPVVTHQENLNTLLDVLKSTSDGHFRNRRIRRNQTIASGVAEATHAMAALENLQALLSSLKNNMNDQSSSRACCSPAPALMTPFPSTPNKRERIAQEFNSVFNDPEPTVETRGDTTIITTARAPIKRAPKPPPSSLGTTCSPRTISSSNTSTAGTSTNSAPSCSTSGSFDRSNFSNSPVSNLRRSQSISAPCRSGITPTSLQAKKLTHGGLSTQPPRPRQSSPPRRNQNHGCWLNRNNTLSSPIQTPNSATKDCSKSVSDSASVRSSCHSYCTRRVYQLAQPKKRYLEATKNDYQSVLRQPYLDRLNKRISLADTKIPQTPHTEMKTKVPARKRPPTMAERIDRKIARMMKYCPDDDEEEKTLESVSNCVQETISTTSEESETDAPLSIHYNSPSDESQIADINNREYYHFSDRSDYSAAALNTVEFGGFVYVGVENKPKGVTTEEFVGNDVSMHEVNQNNNFINIDVDTWNIITQNCIENFKQEEQTLIFQTVMSPPKPNEVTISELTDSQEDLLNTSFVQENVDCHFDVSDFDDQKCVNVINAKLKNHKNEENVSSVLLTLLNEVDLVNLCTDLCLGCNIEPLEKYDAPILPVSGLAIVDEHSSSFKEENVSTTSKEDVESIISELMEDMLEKVTELSMVNTISFPRFSDTESQFSDKSFESSATDLELSDHVTADWGKVNELKRRKTYHPKQCIPDEIAIALQDNYDPNIVFGIVKQYLSSESETESLNTEISNIVEVEGKEADSHMNSEVDLCGLYETFGEGSSCDETSHISTNESISMNTAFSEISFSSIIDAFPLEGGNADATVNCVVTNLGHLTNRTLQNYENEELSTVESEQDLRHVEKQHSGTLTENSEVVYCETENHCSRQQNEYNTAPEDKSNHSSQTTFTSESQTLNESLSQMKLTVDYQNGSMNNSETKHSIEENVSQFLSRTKFTSQTRNDGHNKVQADCVVTDQEVSQNTSSNSRMQKEESTKVRPQTNLSNAADLDPSETDVNHNSRTNNMTYQNIIDSSTSIDGSTRTTKCSTVSTYPTSNQDMQNKTHSQFQISTELWDFETQVHECAASQHDFITQKTVECVISEEHLETSQDPSSHTETAIRRRMATIEQHSTCNSTLDTILPPNTSLLASVNNSVSVLATCSVSSLPYHNMLVSEVSSEVFPARSATCVILPVLDITTPGTVRNLLGAITHVTSSTGTSGEDPDASDTTLRPRSMETLLKQFSATSIPGVQEQRDDVPQEEALDSLLESLALLPEPIYYGLYSTSTIPLTKHRVTNLARLPWDMETIRSDRNVQTDDDNITWPTLSTEEIFHGEHVISNSTVGSKAESVPCLGDRPREDMEELETRTSVSSPGLLLNVETSDLPYVGEAERRSLEDLAIYTDILVSYSSRERIAELMSSLREREPTNGVTTTTTLDGEPAETHRKVVIISIAYFLVSFIMFGVLTLPTRCE